MRPYALRISPALVLTLCLAAACTSRGRTGPMTHNPNLISAGEIHEMREAGATDLYEVVNRLRPLWLQVRANRSLRLDTILLVYHENTRLGGVDVLRGYPLTAVMSLRYLDAAQAGRLPGAGSAHIEGAIVISTTTGR